MKNKAVKSLIAVFGMIIFSFVFVNVASARFSNYDDEPYYGGYYDYNYQTYNHSYDDYYYSNQEYYEPQYGSYQQPNTTVVLVPSNTSSTTTSTQPKSTVNNYYYYYQKTPTTSEVSTTTINNPIPVAKTTTTNATYSDVSRIDTSDGYYNYNNGLASAAYDGYSRANTNSNSKITALSFKGSGGFMPSSIWQWLIVVFLILIIVIIARMLTHRTTVIQESHTTPTPAH